MQQKGRLYLYLELPLVSERIALLSALGSVISVGMTGMVSWPMPTGMVAWPRLHRTERGGLGDVFSTKHGSTLFHGAPNGLNIPSLAALFPLITKIYFLKCKFFDSFFH